MPLCLLLAGCPASGQVAIDDVQDNRTPTAEPTVDGVLKPGVDEPGGINGIDSACLTLVQEAEPRPVAMYVMLDSSRSMEELVGTGSSKWESIQRAIRRFLNETQQSDLSIGLQYFPLLKPDSSFTCTAHSDCGAEGGPCYLSTCEQGNTIRLCRTAADCPGTTSDNPCLPFGVCSATKGDNAVACILGQECDDDAEGNSQGRCEDFERHCTNATECNAGAYQSPAVAMGSIAERIADIDQSLSARSLQGLTPTAPALQGAIEYAEQWGLEHPEQTVVAVLATDGLPTECGDDLSNIVDIAQAGVRARPAVRTVVVGVFEPGDELGIDNVNQIASAGGTKKAVVIDTGADVTAQFLDALRSIRGNTLACEFQLSKVALNYDLVNLQFRSEPDGTAEQLGYVPNAAMCDGQGRNWYYNVDPLLGTPTRIEVCPTVCASLKAADQGLVSLQIGCKTLIF